MMRGASFKKRFTISMQGNVLLKLYSFMHYSLIFYALFIDMFICWLIHVINRYFAHLFLFWFVIDFIYCFLRDSMCSKYLNEVDSKSYKFCTSLSR